MQRSEILQQWVKSHFKTPPGRESNASVLSGIISVCRASPATHSREELEAFISVYPMTSSLPLLKKRRGSLEGSRPILCTWLQQAFKMHLNQFSFQILLHLTSFYLFPILWKSPELLLQTSLTMKYILRMTVQSLGEYIGVNSINISQRCWMNKERTIMQH